MLIIILIVSALFHHESNLSDAVGLSTGDSLCNQHWHRVCIQYKDALARALTLHHLIRKSGILRVASSDRTDLFQIFTS